MSCKILLSLSYFIAALSIWEIVLGFNGDLISLGSIKIRLLLAFLNCIFGATQFFFINKIKVTNSDLYFSISILLISFIGLIWTSLGIIIFNNTYALADGQGLIAAISFLGIYFSIFRKDISEKTLNYVFQTPLILLFSFISILWLLQLLIGLDSKIVLDFINRYSSSTFIGANNELGRFFFLNTILLPLSVFIFSIRSQKLSSFEFWLYLVFYSISILAVGSRGIAISCLIILIPVCILKIIRNCMKYGNIKSIFKSLIPILALIFLLNSSFGEALLSGSRFFDSNATATFSESDDLRYKQFVYLINGFFEAPFLGHGFGYFISSFLRSYDSPFSYELFFVALLAKIGIIGFLIYLLALTLLLFSMYARARSISNLSALFAFLSFMTTIFQAATNPFLDKQVGLLLLVGPYMYLSLLSKSKLSKVA